MPAEGWPTGARAGVLSLDELVRVVAVFAELGVRRVRLTGGEPLVRRGIVDFVRRVAALPGIDDVAMTTNGHLLARDARALREAGLTGLNVSLDTFDADRFAAITRGGDLNAVLAGLHAAQAAGFEGIKINAVALAGLNDDAFVELVDRCWREGWLPRFIEVMPIGGLGDQRAHRLDSAQVFAAISAHFPLAWQTPSAQRAPRGPARYAVVTGGPAKGREVGFISPMSDDGFCGTCNRVRLTARGGFRPCLADDHEVSILQAVRGGADDAALKALIQAAVAGKLEAHHLRTPTRAPLATMTGIGG